MQLLIDTLPTHTHRSYLQLTSIWQIPLYIYFLGGQFSSEIWYLVVKYWNVVRESCGQDCTLVWF